MLNELLILTKIKAGDIKAFEELFRCYYSPLCWYAASITGRMEVAEEIVEELFYVLWKDREQLQIFQSVKNYLYRATRNQSIQYCEHEEVKERYRESVLTASSSEQVTDPHQQMEYEELQIVEGKDYCTLFTCTPYGINTHRLLVRGIRIETITEKPAIYVANEAFRIKPLLVTPAVAMPMVLVFLIHLMIKYREPPKKKEGDQHYGT